MTGLWLAREMLLLGAECTVQTPVNEIAFAHEGWRVHRQRWSDLGRRMRQRGADAMRERLCSHLGLTETGYWLLMLCGAVELFPEAAAAASILCEQDRVHLVTPMTFARLMRAALETPINDSLGEALESGLARLLGLIEGAEPPACRPLTQQPLRLIASEVPLILAGGGQVGSVQPGMLEQEPPASSTVFDNAQVSLAAELLNERRLICIQATTPRSARQFVLDIGAFLRMPVSLIPVKDELPTAAAIGRVRDAIAFLDLGVWSRSQGTPLAKLREMADLAPRLVVGIASDAASGQWPAVRAVPITHDMSHKVWELAGASAELAQSLARRFRVSLDEARTAIRSASDSGRLRGSSLDEAELVPQLLAQGARRMGKSVTIMQPRAELDALVAPPALKKQLEEILLWHRNSGRVFGEMGLGENAPFGRGLICLFSGPPGTGKTFAAQCLAKSFGLNLYRIDLSQVVSKYIGETEKALAAVFDEAEAGHGVLLFDEADALFGKRSEVKDAHDRYANIEVGYLLQRLEAFDGVVILASNLRQNIDPAFLRRLRFLLEFNMPDSGMRRQLWEQALPSEAFRAAGLDLRPFVNQFKLSGGNIQNIGMLAAHLAAASADGLVHTGHLVRATFRELEKTGQPRGAKDFGPLAPYLESEVMA